MRSLRLRAFVKEQGLDVRTSGKGRNKKTIYADVVKLWSSKDGSVEAAAVVAEAAAPAAVEEPKPAPEPVEEPAAAEEFAGAPPGGFEWGGTF